DATSEISEVFGTAPPKKTIHVIVQRPLSDAGPSTSSTAKRRPELILEPPPKRVKAFSFPVDSIANFKELREDNYFYADKTKYIKDIENDRPVLMFLRPKRFGKSLLLSTLKYFYDINEAANFDTLFGSLEIYQHALELQHNQFLILKWDFSTINRCTDTQEMNLSLRNHVNASIKAFCQRYKYILGLKSSDILTIINPDDCLDSISNAFLLVEPTGLKVYVLVDEYDAIINEYLDPTDAQSYQQVRDKQSQLKALFGVIKRYRNEGVISRVFITGVSPLSMNDIASGSNIVDDVTLEPIYEHLLGLSKDDLQQALNDILSQRESMNEEEKRVFVEAHIKQMREYYNGYKFRSTTDDNGIFCTNLCLDYLERLLVNRTLRLADPNNELSESVLKFIGRHPDSTSLLVNLLDNNHVSYSEVQHNIRLQDLANFQNLDQSFLKSFLFYFGALTYSEQPNMLKIPNKVVARTIIERVLQLSAISIDSNAYKKAIDDLIKLNDIRPLCSYLEPKMKDWIKLGNLYDDKELVTKIMFQVSLSAMPRYLNDTEVSVPIINVDCKKAHIGNGYIDLIIAEVKDTTQETKPKKRFVFEFKCKGVNFLSLKGGSSWEQMENKAKKVEAMSEKDLLALTCGGSDCTSDKGKSIGQILEGAKSQLRNYLENLEVNDILDQNELETVAFVVMTVGSRRFLIRNV
ncbi:hypothetical protein BGX27_003489, partial [Mortierella sp. AM989]